MADAHAHYEDHLGPIYEWMSGPFEEACVPSNELFEELKLKPGQTRIAVDLGSGHGLQAVPLARRQFEVIAVDTCQELLESLAARSTGLAITTLQSDINDCWDEIPAQIDLVVCMDDTLTHLQSKNEVKALIARAATHLAAGGTFVTTFRDLIYERSDREWVLTVSAYPKFRLDPDWAASVLEDCELTISVNRVERGMVTLVANP